MKRFVRMVRGGLLPRLRIASENPYDPIVVHHIPSPWQLAGAGNYAAVVYHPDYPDWVVKVYAPGRPGLEAEVEVYRKLGPHPAFARCLHAGENFLVLTRLKGITLYNCLMRGIRIPEQVIKDIDGALAYAEKRGLHPRDVHAKNVMMLDGCGLVVDISDFGKAEPCSKWADLKRAYYRFYLPLLYRHPIPIPPLVLNLVRKGYRFYNRHFLESD